MIEHTPVLDDSSAMQLLRTCQKYEMREQAVYIQKVERKRERDIMGLGACVCVRILSGES